MGVEQWLPLPVAGFESSHEVSSFGRVRSLPRVNNRSHRVKGRVLSAAAGKNGYLRLPVSRDGISVNVYVHRIVAAAFIGERPDGCDVCHCDGDKQNNHASNLRYDSRSANVLDDFRHGVRHRGERSHAAKLTDAEVQAVVLAKACGLPIQEIADTYGISKAYVYQLANGDSRKEVSGERLPKKQRQKLSSCEVKEIVRLHRLGLSERKIASRFPVTRSGVRHVIKREVANGRF